MKKFTFELERLLDLRKHNERLVQMELAKEQAELNKEIGRKDMFIKEYDSALKEMALFQQGLIDVDILMQYSNYLDGLEWESKQQDVVIEAARRRVHKVIVKLNKATQQRKIIEEIKKKKFTEWNHEAEKEAGLEMDEIAAIRALGFNSISGEGENDLRNQ